jgi:hypothetical protein
MVSPACLVCFISTVNGRIKKGNKKPWKPRACSSHITNLKQSIFCLSISMDPNQDYGLDQISHTRQNLRAVSQFCPYKPMKAKLTRTSRQLIIMAKSQGTKLFHFLFPSFLSSQLFGARVTRLGNFSPFRLLL